MKFNKLLLSILTMILALTFCLTTACGEKSISKDAQAVIDLINDLPQTITGYSAGDIEIAENAYAELTDEDKTQISNYSALQSARSEYDSKYVSILSMADLSLISDYSYWFSGTTDANFSLFEDTQNVYGRLLKIEQKGSHGPIVIKYRTDAIDLSDCTKVVFTIVNGSSADANLDTKASGSFSGQENDIWASQQWIIVEKDAATYKGINQDDNSPKAGEGQIGIWTGGRGTFYLAGIYAEKVQ